LIINKIISAYIKIKKFQAYIYLMKNFILSLTIILAFSTCSKNMKKIIPSKTGEWTYVWCQDNSKQGMYKFKDNGTYEHTENGKLIRTGKYTIFNNDALSLTNDGTGFGWNLVELYELTTYHNESFTMALTHTIAMPNNDTVARTSCFYKLTKK
jgi:hypothetical protein